MILRSNVRFGQKRAFRNVRVVPILFNESGLEVLWSDRSDHDWVLGYIAGSGGWFEIRFVSWPRRRGEIVTSAA
jgi:hypothetical protein